MNENVKFLLQTLIVPLVLAFFGFKINSTISEKDRAYDRINLPIKLLPMHLTAPILIKHWQCWIYYHMLWRILH